MTKEQIAALIAAKIAGQGSMVDIGGALPEILTALAENGISTDMTVAEQMQARKDLGLYYEETTTGEKTASYTDEQEEPSGLWKISDDTPSKDDIVGVSVGGGDPTLADYELVDIDGGYVITLLNIGPKFQIIFEETGGKTPGIYCTSSGKLSSLVYNGPTTVVSKVPDKYLPIAWNQLVTEGTKIAEVTIGGETTNVFAPEGGGAPEFVLMSDALQDADEVDVTQQFGISGADYIALCKGEKAGLKFFSSGNSYYQFIGGFYSETDAAAIAFYVYDAATKTVWKFMGVASMVTVTHYVLATGTVPGPVTLSALPTASMTTQEELDAIGLTATNMQAAIDGKKTAINYTDMAGTKYMGVFVSGLSLDSALLKTIVFTLNGNKYSVSNQAGTVTVTVTPLT